MASAAPGSLVFCHSTGLIGRAIRLGERLRFRTGAFYNHVAIIADTDADPHVIQAEASGVTSNGTLSSVAPGGSYLIYPLPDGVDPAKVLRFARSQVGLSYGWLSILSLAIQILVPKWIHLPSFRSERSWICSAMGGESIRFGGWLWNWGDIYKVVPSELYAALERMDVRDVGRLMKTGR